MTRDHRVNVGIRIAERQVRSIGNHSRLQPEFSLSFMRVSTTSHSALICTKSRVIPPQVKMSVKCVTLKRGDYTNPFATSM